MRTSAETDLRLRAEVESLLGNLAHEREKPAEAEARYRVAASLFETVRDTQAVARQLAAVGQTLLAQERPEDAVDLLRAAVDRMPNDPVMQTELGLALWQAWRRPRRSRSPHRCTRDRRRESRRAARHAARSSPISVTRAARCSTLTA